MNRSTYLFSLVAIMGFALRVSIAQEQFIGLEFKPDNTKVSTVLGTIDIANSLSGRIGVWKNADNAVYLGPGEVKDSIDGFGAVFGVEVFNEARNKCDGIPVIPAAFAQYKVRWLDGLKVHISRKGDDKVVWTYNCATNEIS